MSPPGEGVELPPKGSLVEDATISFAISVLAGSGVPQRLENKLARRTGRRRGLSVLALLVALFCLALDDRPLHLSLATDLLYRRLSEPAAVLLDVRGEARTKKRFLARYRCVRYLFHQLLGVVDPSVLPKNRRLLPEELAARAKPASNEEIATRRQGLEALVNDLIEASCSLISAEEAAAYDGAIGLDATPVPLFSRGPSRRSGLSASDPDGGWYVREGDHRGEEDHKGRVRGKVAWALEATIATMAPPVGDPAAHPNLVLGVVLDRPGMDPGGTGARVLASVAARGHERGYVGADRAYSSAHASSFHLPLRALGYEPVFDYREDELGLQANSQGAILVEGGWYCPAMPRTLIQASKDHRSGAIETQIYATRLIARADYRLFRKDGPDEDGYERFSCPAQGPHQRLTCPLRPDSLGKGNGSMKVLDPPDAPPRVCCQGSITIAPDVGAKHRQRLAFGTKEWQRRYGTCRNAIEGLNGFAKDPAHESLASPGRRRVRGIAAQSLFIGLLLMAANVRKLRAHRELVAEGGREQAARRARRRRTSLGDYRPSQ